MIERDSWHSFAGRVHTAALKVANPQQKKHLQEEVQRRRSEHPDRLLKGRV